MQYLARRFTARSYVISQTNHNKRGKFLTPLNVVKIWETSEYEIFLHFPVS